LTRTVYLKSQDALKLACMHYAAPNPESWYR